MKFDRTFFKFAWSNLVTPCLAHIDSMHGKVSQYYPLPHILSKRGTKCYRILKGKQCTYIEF
jgi:hypothetical protein